MVYCCCSVVYIGLNVWPIYYFVIIIKSVRSLCGSHFNKCVADQPGAVQPDVFTSQPVSGSKDCVGFGDIISIPKRLLKTNSVSRKRKVAHAVIVTGSPYKAEIQSAQRVANDKKKKKEDKKSEKEGNGKGKGEKKKGKGKNKEKRSESHKNKKGQETESHQNKKRKRTDSDKKDNGDKVGQPDKGSKRVKLSDKKTKVADDDDTVSNKSSKQINGNDKVTSDMCFYCEEETDDAWIKCMKCHRWAHDVCAGIGKKEKQYICEFCQ